MAEFALRELIDEKRLQHLQNEFCKVTGVMAVCVDKEGRAITEPYIDKSLIRPDGEDPILGEYRKKAAQALDRVQEGSLEEQVVKSCRMADMWQQLPSVWRIRSFCTGRYMI